jgi:hypothetical protein
MAAQKKQEILLVSVVTTPHLEVMLSQPTSAARSLLMHPSMLLLEYT